MSDSADAHIPDHELPCPQCGYDLRAHPGLARCPECGTTVSAAAVARDENRWADHRVLDLWSVALLLVLGFLSAVVSLVAIRGGQYVAVVSGMMATLYLAGAGIWFGVVVTRIVRHRARPPFRTITPARRGRLRLLLMFDAAVVALIVLFITAAGRFMS